MLVLSYSSGVLKSHNLSMWIGGSKGQGWNDFIGSPTNKC
jgi:hypothetical protein